MRIFPAILLFACSTEPSEVVALPSEDTTPEWQEQPPWTIETPGASVTLPASVPADAGITVTAQQRVPEGLLMRSPVFAFEPHGMAFDDAVRVDLEFTGDGHVAIWWSDDGATWVPMNTTVADGIASTQVHHFSWGVVAVAPPLDTADSDLRRDSADSGLGDTFDTESPEDTGESGAASGSGIPADTGDTWSDTEADSWPDSEVDSWQSEDTDTDFVPWDTGLDSFIVLTVFETDSEPPLEHFSPR